MPTRHTMATVPEIRVDWCLIVRCPIIAVFTPQESGPKSHAQADVACAWVHGSKSTSTLYRGMQRKPIENRLLGATVLAHTSPVHAALAKAQSVFQWQELHDEVGAFGRQMLEEGNRPCTVLPVHHARDLSTRGGRRRGWCVCVFHTRPRLRGKPTGPPPPCCRRRRFVAAGACCGFADACHGA